MGSEYSKHIIQKRIGTINYHKYIICKKKWVNKKTAKNCMNWAIIMLETYFYLKNWPII